MRHKQEPLEAILRRVVREEIHRAGQGAVFGNEAKLAAGLFSKLLIINMLCGFSRGGEGVSRRRAWSQQAGVRGD